MAIPNQTITTHHVGNVMEDIAMSMRAEDFPHIASLLTNLYSDPIAAVVREYCTNAWDSHVSAGVFRPIEVTLPTEGNLEFVIQDFGLGLSVDDLRNVYSMYGRSLKRDTNDVAGQLGLGCKSGLTYAEAFTIVAVKGGIKTVAMSTKDEHGVGVIKVLDTVGTDEPNGVRITIPVERWDVNTFRQTAENLFQFWEQGTVLVNGEAPEVPAWRASALRLDDDTFLVRHDAGLHSSHVIMGNVAYPVPDAQVGRVLHRFVARLNIGDVDFVPSREAVHHTRHTDATLAELTEYIGDTYKRAVARAQAAAASRWEETMLKALWMDRNLQFTTHADAPIWLYSPDAYGNQKARSHFKYRIDALAHSAKTVVVTEFPAKNLSTVARDRLREFFSHSKHMSYVIIPENVTGVGMLEGRPNTHTWAEIAGATAAPKDNGPKVKREKYETRYAIVGGGAMTGDELSAVKGEVLFLYPGYSATHGTFGATVVSLRSANQLPRVKRFVPGIVEYGIALDRERTKAGKAVTALDRKIVTARTLPDHFKNVNPDDVKDPELAEAIRMKRLPDTDTIKEAKKFGHAIAPTQNLSETFAKRYPLVSAASYYSYRIGDMPGEILIYINARYDMVTAQLALDTKAS